MVERWFPKRVSHAAVGDRRLKLSMPELEDILKRQIESCGGVPDPSIRAVWTAFSNVISALKRSEEPSPDTKMAVGRIILKIVKDQPPLNHLGQTDPRQLAIEAMQIFLASLATKPTEAL